MYIHVHVGDSYRKRGEGKKVHVYTRGKDRDRKGRVKRKDSNNCLHNIIIVNTKL